MNHTLAERECRTGWLFEDHVAQVLRVKGLDVETPPKSWRATVEDRHAYVNELDMLVNGLRFSVKSRRVKFTSPEDIPNNRNPLFVDAARKWGQKDPTPAAVVCVSQETRAIIWTPCSTAAYWGVKHAYDNVRGFSQDFLTADRSLWHPLDDLVIAASSVWDGTWSVRTGTVQVKSNRIVRTGTDLTLQRFVGTPFHLVRRYATVRPERLLK